MSGDIEQHKSSVRGLISRARGTPSYPLHSLDEAKTYADGVVILEGDSGGHIYAVAPASRVRCDELTLGQLLRDVDRIAWAVNEGKYAAIYYERRPMGSGIAGGMGGGRVIDGVWVHDEFFELGIAAEIQAVIEGRSERLTSSYDSVYAIVRVDTETKRTEWEDRIRIVKIVWSYDEAEAEVERLNRERSSNGYSYFHTTETLLEARE